MWAPSGIAGYGVLTSDSNFGHFPEILENVYFIIQKFCVIVPEILDQVYYFLFHHQTLQKIFCV
jgi:hypothetical protein